MTLNARPAYPRQSYRPDVDGLRAVAVLAVIAFHANTQLISGGFIGVDIFFVISGYLITGLIARRIEDNTFSITGFYTGRIKRILPAYIVVALATLAVSSWLLIPNDYIFYTTSLAASWGFASNIFFSMLSWGYFGTRSEEFPLLHTWSLAVEEQFYFIYPLFLILLYRYARKLVVPLLVVLALALMVLSELKTGEVKSYFLLTTRAHELLIGALTAFIGQRTPAPGRVVARLLAFAGMAMMIGAMFLIEGGTPYPGVRSLFPCVGAALVIYAGRTGNPVSALLSTKPVVFVGLISYSLYLWHWPIVTFLRYRQIEIDLAVGIGAFALTVVLSILTWKYVEMPIRHMDIQFKRAFVQIYALPAAAFIAVGAYSYFTEGAPKRFSGDMMELITSYSFERDLGRTCAIRGEDYRKIDAAYLEKNCAFGDLVQEKPQVLLMGDSHANHFKPFLDALAKAANLKAVFHVQGGCAPVILDSGASADETVKTCEKRNKDLLELASHYKYVVLGGAWANPPPSFEKDLQAVVHIIQAAGATPVIFKDNAFSEENLSQCILHRTRGWVPKDTNCNIPYKFVEATEGPPDRVIDKVVQGAAAKDVIVIDPKKVMCNATECLTYIGNMALYKDGNHINTKAAHFLGDQYVAKVGNPFDRNQAGKDNVKVAATGTTTNAASQ